MGFPIINRVTSLDNLPVDSDYMHSIVIGRNDTNLPKPPLIEEEADLFLECREQVVKGKWPTDYFVSLGIDPEPTSLLKAVGVRSTRPRTATSLVDHTMDHPLDLHTFATSHFMGKYEVKSHARPATAGVNFLGARELDTKISEIIYQALIDAFQAKYYFVRERPEHYFRSGPLVAQYPCPPHPAYPAGHGAIAGAIYQSWRMLVDAEEEVLEELELSAHQYAHFRTLAGVHWASDNAAGVDSGIATAIRVAA